MRFLPSKFRLCSKAELVTLLLFQGNTCIYQVCCAIIILETFGAGCNSRPAV